MKTVCEINKCNGCMLCLSICPKHCITIKDDIATFNAIIDESVCINCHLCEKTCPNINKPIKNKPIKWKQGWAEEKIRNHSSSGGAASAMIKSFISSGGYVASCLFKDGEFVFDLTNDIEVAKKFAGSKYVKSNAKGVYEKIKERLKNNKVLFIGLPCQVAALKNYIKNQENLFTVDLICHGTPSPRLLDKFLLEHGYIPTKCQDIKFRNNTLFKMMIDNNPIVPKEQDDYLIAFLDSINYTENCYSCQFATLDRVGDVTLGDSWGSEYIEEERYGISLILIQTDKGKELVLQSALELKNVNINNAIKENSQLRHPSALKPEREKFLKIIINGGKFSKAMSSVYRKRIIKKHIKKICMRLGVFKYH